MSLDNRALLTLMNGLAHTVEEQGKAMNKLADRLIQLQDQVVRLAEVTHALVPLKEPLPRPAKVQTEDN